MPSAKKLGAITFIDQAQAIEALIIESKRPRHRIADTTILGHLGETIELAKNYRKKYGVDADSTTSKIWMWKPLFYVIPCGTDCSLF